MKMRQSCFSLPARPLHLLTVEGLLYSATRQVLPCRSISSERAFSLILGSCGRKPELLLYFFTPPERVS